MIAYEIGKEIRSLDQQDGAHLNVRHVNELINKIK